MPDKQSNNADNTAAVGTKAYNIKDNRTTKTETTDRYSNSGDVKQKVTLYVLLFIYNTAGYFIFCRKKMPTIVKIIHTNFLHKLFYF